LAGLVGAAAVGGGAGGCALASAFSGGAFGLNGCCVGWFSTPVSAGYRAGVYRARAGRVSSSVQAETRNAVSSASESHNFIIFLDEVYTGSISMPVPSKAQLIL
jgi:hypothetical protein